MGNIQYLLEKLVKEYAELPAEARTETMNALIERYKNLHEQAGVVKEYINLAIIYEAAQKELSRTGYGLVEVEVKHIHELPEHPLYEDGLDDSPPAELWLTIHRYGMDSAGLHEGTEAATAKLCIYNAHEIDTFTNAAKAVFDEYANYYVLADMGNYAMSINCPEAWVLDEHYDDCETQQHEDNCLMLDDDNAECTCSAADNGYFPPDEDFFDNEFQHVWKDILQHAATLRWVFGKISDEEGDNGWAIVDKYESPDSVELY